jgi:hypothetical protein
MLNERLDQVLRTELLLSLQRAMLGVVPASLRAVTCDWDEGRVTLRYLFDGSVQLGDAAAMAAVGVEVAGDFRDTVAVEEQFIRSDHPAGLTPHFLRAWAYMRKEAPAEDFLVPRAGTNEPQG